ncbi:PREDICTED: neurofibromin-like [Acropora digitifera]|uniref:neurofibromin-like n=1 Tax=Acropora digitifera TaxID=70779 RepID=UPI00077A775B|nr:PREDICTED: neurofibromin-like [Acropora digitifera]
MQRESKSDDWVKLVLQRFRSQLPYESSHSQKSHESLDHIKGCIVSLSEHNFAMVVAELASFFKEPSFLSSLSSEKMMLASQSNRNTLATMAKCFEQNPDKCASLPDEILNKQLLPGICQFITQSNGFPLEAEQKALAGRILSHISVHHFSALFNRIVIRLHVLARTEDNSDTGDIELIRHLHVNISSLKILLQESIQVFKSLKKFGQLALVSGLEKAIWNWVENSPEEFAKLQRQPSPELSDYAEKLFDLVDSFAESSKRKAAVWPLQIMLLILCPNTLKQIATGENVLDSCKANKKEFLDHLKKALTSTKTLTEIAAVVCVNLCKVATYMKPEDNSVLCFLVVEILNELKTLLFNASKPFSVGSGSFLTTDALMADCFVSSFRINHRNNQHFDICLQPDSPIIYHLAFVRGTSSIVKEASLSWWPKAEVLHPKGPALRLLFLSACSRVQNAEQEGQQSRLSQIYKVKDKKHKENETNSNKKHDKELLLWLVKIFHADPIFAFHNPDLHGWEIQKNSSQVILGVVNLILTPSLPDDIRHEASQALLCFFQSDFIEMWNPVTPIASFWAISSQVMVSFAEFLIGHGSHGTALLHYLRALTLRKNEFLRKHKEQASIGYHIPICNVAQTKLEEIFLTFLWSPDVETVLISLSCFGHMCNELEIIQNSDSPNEIPIAQDMHVYRSLSDEASKFRSGRAALQRRIMALLRQLDRQTQGNLQAWESTYTKWQKLTYDLANFAKEETSSTMDVQKYLRRKSASKLNMDNLQAFLNEWTYMTGFLCSLGGVCLTSIQSLRRYSRSLPSSVHSVNQSQKIENVTITKFMQDLLSLLVCSNERTGLQIRGTIIEMVGGELSEKLYPILLTQIMIVVGSFFAPSGQVIVQERHTLFTEQIIVIVKHILENTLGHKNSTQMRGIDAMILSFVRYVRNLPICQQTLQIKCKLCQLIDVVMAKRDELLLHQEVKLRNKLVEYLTDWVLPSAEHRESIPAELSVLSKELDATVMRAIASLLSGLPLQPEGTETDIVEAKSQLFLKYFTLFMNLMNTEKNVIRTRENLCHVASQKLHQNSVLAMSNLLNANIDTGLMYAIGLGYHDDLLTRAVFMEVLTKILQQGTEFDNLADTVLMDRFDRLVDLLSLKGENGRLPIALALASVTPVQQMDELAHVLVTLFDDRHILPQLLNNLFTSEVYCAEGMQTLFRGNSLASKTMTYCFKAFGGNYLHTLLAPLITPMYKEMVSFEVDPTRLEKGQSVEENRNNLIKAAQKFFNEIMISVDSFPVQLKNLCYCLREVVHQRFPKHSLEAVGSAFFLRFINPAITSPHLTGIVDQIPSEKLMRGLKLLSKILQNLGNHVLFTKEQHMEPFNGFLQANFEKARDFFSAISSNCPSKRDEDNTSYSFISDSSVLTLHKLLWDHQEKIGTYLATKSEFKTFGRRPFEKMSTLLAHLGPPDQQKNHFSHARWQDGAARFEEFMARHAEESRDDIQAIKSLNVFYQGGKSKAGNLVFYYIARRFRGDQISDELLLYHALLTIEGCIEKPWELVVDFTHTTLENRFSPSTVSKLLRVAPDDAVKNLAAAFIYNCSSSMREYAKYNERNLAPLKGRSVVRVCESLSKLHEYISPSELMLPSSTLTLEEDLKVFPAFRVSSKSNVIVKVGPTSVQITTPERHKVLGYSSILNDVYYASEIKGATVEDDNLCLLKLVNVGPGILLMSSHTEQIVEAVTHVKTRWQLSQPDSSTAASKKIKPKDVPGTLLNMALLNLGTSDPSLRLAAYNLLCSVTKSFNLKIEERLLEGTGLCIPANNTLFIVGISEKLAAREPQLTLEFLEECIAGFVKSDYELKHLCLEYMAPWLPNLARFFRYPADDPQKVKMTHILEELINLTVKEKGAMYPSVQATIWGNVGKVTELLDTVLDCFIKASATGGLGSVKAEVMADTAVALASANVQVVSRKVIGRLDSLISKTFISPTLRLEQHLMWDDIAILTRYLLMLSFNDCLDVASHIPYLFHLVSLLVATGPPTIRASIHGLVINIIQSLCTCSCIKFSDETHRLLRLRLAELSTPKFYLLFGISKVKTPAVKAFKATYHGRYTLRDCESDALSMSAMETVTDLLLEIMESCMTDLPECTWLKKWTELASKFAFDFNPALQPRSIVVLGCICKEADDKLIEKVLQVLMMALSTYSDLVLMEAAFMCLSRLQVILHKDSKFHKAFFWIAIAMLQLSEVQLYPCGLALLEQTLITLETHGAFESQPVDKVLLAVRQEPLLEFHCKQMDHFVGLHFSNNFHFALMVHLVKGVYHPQATSSARAIRILNLMYNITSKRKTSRGSFVVNKENLAYLAALIPVSEEVRSNLRPGDQTDPDSPILPCPCKLENSRNAGSETSLDSQVSIVITTSSSPRPDDNPSDRAFVWPTECQNMLLNPGVVNDSQTQALLLTTLAILLEHVTGDVETRYLYEVLAEASLVFPGVFPVIYTLLDSDLTIVIGHSDDVTTLKAIQTIVHSMSAVKRAEDPALKSSYLSTIGFSGFSHFTKFKECSGQANRAQLFMKFLEAVLEVYGVSAPEEKTHRSSSVASIKPLMVSSSSEDLRAGPSSALSTSLSSLTGAVANGKNIYIPIPFKRSGSSIRHKKTEKESPKFRRHWSSRGPRSSSGKSAKW